MLKLHTLPISSYKWMYQNDVMFYSFIVKVTPMILVCLMPIFCLWYLPSDCPWGEGSSAACSPTLSGVQGGRHQQRRMRVHHDPACQENLIDDSFIIKKFQRQWWADLVLLKNIEKQSPKKKNREALWRTHGLNYEHWHVVAFELA
jgi:hypothetical protein